MRVAAIAAALLALLLPALATGQAAPKGWTGSFRKPSDEELRQKLTPLQYQVTQKEGTERAFANEYW
ncbi:MAG: hypothetical protein ACRD3M_13385, partial [Thermoanaerobaculia bacterium]